MEEQLRTQLPPADSSTLQMVSAFESGFPHKVHDWTPRADKADRNIYIEIAKECTKVVKVSAASRVSDTDPLWVRGAGWRDLVVSGHNGFACRLNTPVKTKRKFRQSSVDVVDAMERLSASWRKYVLCLDAQLLAWDMVSDIVLCCGPSANTNARLLQYIEVLSRHANKTKRCRKQACTSVIFSSAGMASRW